jgi:hypothetical protein
MFIGFNSNFNKNLALGYLNFQMKDYLFILAE